MLHWTYFLVHIFDILDNNMWLFSLHFAYNPCSLSLPLNPLKISVSKRKVSDCMPMVGGFTSICVCVYTKVLGFYTSVGRFLSEIKKYLNNWIFLFSKGG